MKSTILISFIIAIIFVSPAVHGEHLAIFRYAILSSMLGHVTPDDNFNIVLSKGSIITLVKGINFKPGNKQATIEDIQTVPYPPQPGLLTRYYDRHVKCLITTTEVDEVYDRWVEPGTKLTVVSPPSKANFTRTWFYSEALPNYPEIVFQDGANDPLNEPQNLEELRQSVKAYAAGKTFKVKTSSEFEMELYCYYYNLIQNWPNSSKLHFFPSIKKLGGLMVLPEAPIKEIK